MKKIRIEFVKGEEVKYISHLDMAKVFHRAIKRARIPIAYSQGFNPHAHMVFGLPLSIGVTSQNEYADFELEDNTNIQDIRDLLNDELPKGLKIIQCFEKYSKENIMASISAAAYDLLIRSSVDLLELNKIINELKEKTEIIIEKRSKNKMKSIDVRPMIYDVKILNSIHNFDTKLSAESNIQPKEFLGNHNNIYIDNWKQYKDTFVIAMFLKAGNDENLKPEILIQAINDIFNIKLDILKVHRTGLFIKKDTRLLHPLAKEIL